MEQSKHTHNFENRADRCLDCGRSFAEAVAAREPYFSGVREYVNGVMVLERGFVVLSMP